ncbi:MAG TPA: ATP-binding cassette domain-containing protein, partial [Mycobacterium sp.]|nr:ATP-binding cassette domain-containing protein [Mycobacterium sp.]
MSGLFLDVAVAERGVDLQFSVPPGEVLAVLGPNGSGKSTALQLIAGLLRPDRGVVRLGRHVLTDTDSGTFVATHERRVGLLMQDPLLFPHLSVAANVEFAPRRLHGRAQARDTALRWLDEVDATDLANRRPRQLSGGQAQRVAIARALAAEPDVLLLDEPMAGLDVAIAAALRGVLRRVLRRDGRCAILVTHDIL